MALRDVSGECTHTCYMPLRRQPLCVNDCRGHSRQEHASRALKGFVGTETATRIERPLNRAKSAMSDQV